MGGVRLLRDAFAPTSMPYGLYMSAAGAEVQRQRIEVMAHNLANVDTPGFRREMAIAQSRHAEAIERGSSSEGSRGIDDLGGGSMVRETVTEHAPGRIRPTHQRTDMALPGEGYFVVEKEGQEFLTRAGNFTLSSRGELMTQGGHRVLGETGQPITITSPAWRLTPTGAVEQPDGLSNLKLVNAQPGDLAREGENLFRPLADVQPLKAGERNVQSGYLEMSNVSPTTQMTELIEASRAYEANVRMIQNQDQLLGTLVTRVLKPI